MLYKEWLYEWLENYVKPTVKFRSYLKYKKDVNRYILPKLGSYELDKLSSLILQKFTAGLINNNLKISTISGNFDSDSVYYIDSQYIGGNSGYEIIILAFPTYSSFSINNDGIITWATISDAIGYEYQISYNDEEYGNILKTYNASLEPINNYLSYKNIKIKVRAKGNGKNIISSDWSEFLWVNPNL